MRILAIDDKAMPRRALARAIAQADEGAEVVACANAQEVLERDDLASFDVAFVDIDMPVMNGIALARELKRVHPQINIVFATGFGEYMADAFEMHSSGYIMKPITPEKVAAELENLRFPAATAAKAGRVFVRCFGNFETFFNDEPVEFDRIKTKELFAYLVDRRGALCSMAEIEAVIWEGKRSDKSLRSLLRTLIADLRTTLQSLGCAEVVVKSRGVIGIRTDSIDCDYYAFLDGDPLAIASYRGEYMHQYSWAERSQATLYHQLHDE